MIVQFTELLLRDIRERQERITLQLASNSVTSIEQYKFLVGRINGLEEAIVSTQELFDKLVSDRNFSRE